MCAGLRIGAVSALTLFAPVLLPSRAAFAHETGAFDRRHGHPAECQARGRARGHAGHPARGPRGRQQPVSPRPGHGRRQPVVAGRRHARPRSADRRPRARQRHPLRHGHSAAAVEPGGPRRPRGPGRRATVEHLRLAENPGDPGQLLRTIPPSPTPSPRRKPAMRRSTPGSERSRTSKRRSPSTSSAGTRCPLTTAGCDISLMQSKARQAATAAGVNLSTYVRQVYAFPFNANCQFAGHGVGRRHPVECVDQWQCQHGPPRP